MLRVHQCVASDQHQCYHNDLDSTMSTMSMVSYSIRLKYAVHVHLHDHSQLFYLVQFDAKWSTHLMAGSNDCYLYLVDVPALDVIDQSRGPMAYVLTLILFRLQSFHFKFTAMTIIVFVKIDFFWFFTHFFCPPESNTRHCLWNNGRIDTSLDRAFYMLNNIHLFKLPVYRFLLAT